MRAMTLGQLVGQNLRRARMQRNLTQQVLANKAKVSVSYVSMLERCQRTPALEVLEAFAKALDVSPLSLLREPPASSARSRGR
jgi:transcriptional regulator with XRE-family HTH domain